MADHHLDGPFIGPLSQFDWSPERMAMAAQLRAVYEDQGALTGDFAPALQHQCPSAAACWKQAQHRLQPLSATDDGAGEYGSIYWPWIGRRYMPGGVCVVALNINDAHDDGWWSVAKEYGIAHDQQRALAKGELRQGGSSFAYCSMATAAALVTHLAGEQPVAEPTPQSLSGVVDEIARVQAVKCSPRDAKSAPTQAMLRACPPRFAVRELEILKPGVLVGLGKVARSAICLLGEASLSKVSPHLERGTIAINGSSSEVFIVPHPAAHAKKHQSPPWNLAQADLIEELRRNPL